MSLRGDWQAFKNESLEKFKKAHAHELTNVHEGGVTGYPVKFDKDLGPTLDKYEKAKDKDKETYKKKALEVIALYETKANHKDLKGEPADSIKKGLNHLKSKLK